MTFPAGAERYNVDCSPIRARGICWTSADLTADARAAVADALYDRPGMQEDREFLLSLGATGFVDQRVDEVLSDGEVQSVVEQWRVGEAVAQAELEANCACHFPWNVRRDLKNPRASNAGAELVGFHERPDGARCFSFGEVKTSSQQQAPPSVVTDLRRQLRDLQQSAKVVDNLIRYLAPRARGAAWMDHFKAAWHSFCANRRDYAIFGVLVRDTDPPDRLDLSALATALAGDVDAPTTIELRALYFPTGGVAGLADTEAGT